MSNLLELKLVYQNVGVAINKKQAVFLLCVFRDEYLMLDYFITYYKSLGVTHFIMIDNNSGDDGVTFLKSVDDVNMIIYQAKGSFLKSQFGGKWINELLEKYCVNQYCFKVDADELFYLNTSKFDSLQELIDDMEDKNNNAVQAILLDMYPKKINNQYKKGEDFLQHSQFFDQYNTKYYHDNPINRTLLSLEGGVRERIFDVTACMHKFPFFKYNFDSVELTGGYHNFKLNGQIIYNSNDLSLYHTAFTLLHFKFIKPNLKEIFKLRAMRNEDWDNSVEYKSYVTNLTASPFMEIFDKEHSVKFEGNSSLKVFFELQQLNQQMKQKDEQINKKNKQIQQKNILLNEQIQQKNQEMHNMKESKFWKLRSLYLNIKNKIIFMLYSPSKFYKKYFQKKQKLIMTLLVRDEIDIIEENIKFHLAHGVDFIIATDNGSVDGTKEILQKYERKGVLYLINELSQDYSQAVWVNRMGKIAFDKFGASYLFHCDADEFWYPKSGNLKDEIFHIKTDVVKVDLINVLLSNKNGKERFPDDLKYAVTKPILTSDFEKDSRNQNMYLFKYPPKVLFRGYHEVTQGNHDVIECSDGEKGFLKNVIIYHYPLRGKDHFFQKVINGGASYKKNLKLKKKIGWHWRRWYNAYENGTLEHEYELLLLSDKSRINMLKTKMIESFDYYKNIKNKL